MCVTNYGPRMSNYKFGHVYNRVQLVDWIENVFSLRCNMYLI